MAEKSDFDGEIKVASRIVDYLSSGLYKSPAACLKELINNSYDADANRVDVFVKPDADRIIIEDDGHGMDRSDFERDFKVISESHKRDKNDLTKTGRPKIGKIGIGFIAANEICDTMQIISTKKGSSELLDVTINFDLMRQDPVDRRREGTAIAKADYRGTVTETDKASHFTHVFLKEIRGEAKSILAGVGTSEFASGNKSLYGLKPESVFQRLQDKSLSTWSSFDAYSRNVLEVALNVPVQYYDRWLPSLLHSKVRDFEEEVANLNFSVFFDGTDIKKPIVFNPEGKALISRFEYSGTNVTAKGYFYAQHGAIKPQELQGLLIRIRNAAVGEYDQSFLGFSPNIGRLFQTWISGEIMAGDQLEDAMNIDRRTLRDAHPAYVEFRQVVHNHLAGFIKRVRSDIYENQKNKRSTELISSTESKIIKVASSEIAQLAPEAARDMKRVWHRSAGSKTEHKKLLRKFSIDELYIIFIEIAKEVLSPKQLNEFLARLTDRLQK